jgi:hypothetical protein
LSAILEVGGLVMLAGAVALGTLLAISVGCRMVSVNLERRRWLRGGR